MGDVVTFDDPGRAHPLMALSDALERATDDYVKALDAEAEAENAYLRAFSIDYARACAAGVAATIRAKHVDSVPDVVAAKCDWNLAVAAAKRCRAKVAELENRLTAMQSFSRFVSGQS